MTATGERLKEFLTEDASLPEKSGNAIFIFLMTEQTETTEIKMNVRNINVVTARSVLNKTRLDNFTHAVLSNCTTGIFLSVPKKFTPESLLHNFNIAAVGVMKNGMSKSLFSSVGNTVVFGQPCSGKTNLVVEFISSVVGNNKKGEVKWPEFNELRNISPAAFRKKTLSDDCLKKNKQ